MIPVPIRWSSTIPVVAALAGLAAVSGSLRVSAQVDGGESAPAAVATGSGALETAIVVEAFMQGVSGHGPHEQQFVPARKIEAGDEVHYTIRVRNPGKGPVRDVVVTKRLPFGVIYIPGSAVCPACAIEVSTDGGSSFARPTRDDREPTHVRWILRRPLAPGATALLRFRATLR